MSLSSLCGSGGNPNAAYLVTAKGAGAPDDEIEVTEEMAEEGARALADMFEYAVAGDWLTRDRASEVFRRMWLARR